MSETPIFQRYDFTDPSSNSPYTVTIKNDLGLFNALPPAQFNVIHTWMMAA